MLIVKTHCKTHKHELPNTAIVLTVKAGNAAFSAVPGARYQRPLVVEDISYATVQVQISTIVQLHIVRYGQIVPVV